MKLNLITLLAGCISTLCSAQKVTYYDTFDDNKNQWELKQNNIESTIKKGKLIIENNDAEKSKWEMASIINNPDEIDFDVEATITVLESKKDTDTYGLVWSSYNDNSYYNVIQFTPNKQYQMYEYTKDKFRYVKKWTVSNTINGYKSENKIKIVRRGNVIKAYNNGELLFQNGENDYFGSKVGFILDAKVKIAIDELKVTEYPKSVKVVATYDPNLKMNLLPEIISSKEYEETNPVVSADGNTLYITRKDCPQNIETSKDDIWYSVKDSNGNWTPVQNMGRPINNKDYNFIISISPDNNTMMLGNKYSKDGLNPDGAGVSISKKQTNGWEIPNGLDIKDLKNTNEFVAYFLTSDNQTLLSAIENPESYGQKDLFVSFLNNDNTWSKPKNIGNVVNTFENETNPFLASDGKTLYFSSRGHIGYGNHDLFVSKRLDDTWTNWSEPENLGNIINSTSSDLSIFLSAKGDKAYIGRSQDIYEITNTVKQDPVVLVKGKVYDAKTKKTLGTTIQYNNLKTNTSVGNAISDPTTGSYSIILPYGQNYSFMAEKEDYYAITQNIDLANLTEYKEIEVDLYLNPIEKGEVIRLNNIFFDSGKFELLSESFAELNQLFDLLDREKNIKIEIAGHTDDIGSDTNNMILSNNRANAVLNYLIKKGIDASRISAKGYGETKFIAPNTTDEERQQNRRVEFIIIEK